MSDSRIKTLCEQIKQAGASATSLRIEGSGSKAFYGNFAGGSLLSTAGLNGIVQYDPSELVITAMAGTSIADIEAALAEHSQMLAFEPPLIGGNGTLGGMVATAMAGPARPWRGAVRDYLLGVKLINGHGELLRFGGQVMKNVAGYDVSRLMAGSMGCLGVLTEVSIKLVPKPESVQFCRLDGGLNTCLAWARSMAKKMTPLSGVSHDGRQAYIRLEGSSAVLEKFIREQSLITDPASQGYWQDLRHHRGHFFDERDQLDGAAIWMLSLPKWSHLSLGELPFIMDWAGARYWVKGGRYEDLQAIVAPFNGQVNCYKSEPQELMFQAFSLPANAILRLHQNLKKAYDPKGIFNPGRLFWDL